MNLNQTIRSLGVFSLVMIAVVSVDSLRNLPIAAQYGLAVVTFYLIAGITFFFPLAWIAAQLATKYPRTGGSYLWIKDAFGKHFGYLSIWLQWIYNIIWYPTIFAFISVTLASLIHPGWENNKWFILLISLGCFWLLTYAHCLGIRMTSWLSTFSAIIGTLVPMIFVMCLAGYWLFSGHASAISLSWKALMPNQHALHNLAFFSNILFSLLGLEVIAMHAGNVKNPEKNYPRSLFISAILILTTLTLSSLSLCIIIAPEKIALISGLIDTFKLLLDAYHLSFAINWIGWAIVVGGIGIASSWMLGLARGLHTAVLSSELPPILQRLNKRGMPAPILIMQGVVYSILTSVFLLLPNVNNSYWILSALTAQFALLYYVILFAAAIKLLKSIAKTTLHKMLGFLLPGMACLISMIGIMVGFLPPEQVSAGGILKYELLIIGGFLVFCFLLVVVLFRHTKDKNTLKVN